MFKTPISGKDIDLIKKVFFLAMMDGYVGNSYKTKIEQLPGSRNITFKHEEGGCTFVVTDTYWVTEQSDFSSGITVISCDGQPVWSMTYSGRYPKEFIPFLKAALKENYSRNIFNGGRGPTDWTSSEDFPGLVYENTDDCPNFEDFDGCEIIYKSTERDDKAYHYYRGNLMVPVAK